MAFGPDSVPQTGNPYVEGVRLFLRGVDLLDALPFGDSAIQQANRQAAREAGYTGTRDQLNAIGEGLRNAAVFAAGQGGGPGDFNRAGPAARPSAPVASTPPPVASTPPPSSGPSAADQASGFPTSIPLPNIPGLPSSLPLPPVLAGAIGSQILPAIITAGLFWPTAAGQGSDILSVPRPRMPGGRTRGRRGRRAQPRAQPRGNPFPAAGVKGRGGPVTISRPRAQAMPQPVAVPAKMPPKPKVLAGGAGIKVRVGPIKVSAPGQIPRTVTQRAQAVLTNPYIRGLLGAAASGLFAGLLSPSQTAQRGRVTMPNTGPGTLPAPLPVVSPLTALQPQALPYARAQPLAQAAVQEQDCSCRPARKRSKKKPCKNPVTTRRSFERDGKRFVTTTKEIKCQASSRKKRPLRPAQ